MAIRKIHDAIGVGQKFGRWTVISVALPRIYGRSSHARWNCLCDCGVERDVSQLSLRNGTSVSCGCFCRERSIAVNTTHGANAGNRETPEHMVWGAIIQRCENPNNPRFGDYGGRGVAICGEWRNDFAAFLRDVGDRPGEGYSIDRIHNDRGYEPGNVRWATSPEQMVNRRNTRFVDVDGEMIPLATLAKKYGIPANTLRNRVLKGWELNRAFSEPVARRTPWR